MRCNRRLPGMLSSVRPRRRLGASTVPSPKQKSRKPYMTNLLKGWAATLKRAGVPYFTLYEVRHTFATRLREPHGDADVAAGRCRSLQTLQPGEARHDAGSAREAGSRGERAALEFSHGGGPVTDFIHIFRTVGASQQCGEGGRCCSERTSLRYCGRAAGI